jgi:hypothetical protein
MPYPTPLSVSMSKFNESIAIVIGMILPTFIEERMKMKKSEISQPTFPTLTFYIHFLC